MRLINPYTPGAGKMPSYLAGRETLLDEAEANILATVKGYPQNPIIYYGLRGVGKTVLLNAIEKIADEQPIIHEYIEIAERGSFAKQIAICSQKISHRLSYIAAAKDFMEKIKHVVSSFYVTYNPTDNTFTTGLTESSPYNAIGNISEDLTDLIVTLGKVAAKANTPICIFVDEIQYMKKNELEALINALHRSNQLRLPIIFFGAGLPKILKICGEIKSYSERLFHFIEIDSLNEIDAQKAIMEPAKDFDVTFTPDAITEIIHETKGYPYYIQALCSMVWKKTNHDVITISDIIEAVPYHYRELDQSFFKVRFDRCTKKEQDFLFAMVACGELPCTIANVAHFMHSNVTRISPCRAQLIDKGLIYSAGHGLIDFTVPQFDGYLRRLQSASLES